MKIQEPFFELGEHLAADLPHSRVVFTTRNGGFSRGAYHSMNLGRRTGDELDTVLRNRAALERELDVRLAYVRQIHGTQIRRITTGEDADQRPPEGDGILTNLRGLAPAVLTADCVPVAVVGEAAVLMLHAGWRGLAGGIIGEGVRALRELDSGGELTAAIGPGAGPCCYEVGDEVRASFGHRAEHLRDSGTLDLKGIATEDLMRSGATTVHDIGLCTICSPRFFSHRRDRGVTGRQAGVAWLV